MRKLASCDDAPARHSRARSWLVVIAARPLFRAVPPGGLGWLLAGGLAYTLGVTFFSSSRFRFNHAVWHLFVLVGSACHYVAVIHYVLPKTAA